MEQGGDSANPPALKASVSAPDAPAAAAAQATAAAAQPKSKVMKQSKIKQIVQKYLTQLTKGCTIYGCSNRQHCCKAEGFDKTQSKKQLITHALTLAKSHFTTSGFCEDVNALGIDKVDALYAECKQSGSFTALIRRLGLVFGSVELLSKSFMSKDVKQLGLDFPLSAPSNVKPSATQTGMDVDPSSSSSSSSNDKADMADKSSQYMLFVEHPSMSQSRHNEAYESKLSRTSFLHDSGDTSYESKHLPPFIVESSFNGISQNELERFYALVGLEEQLLRVLHSAMGRLLLGIKNRMHQVPTSETDMREFLRIVPICMANPYLFDPEYHSDVLKPLIDVIAGLPVRAKDILVAWLTLFYDKLQLQQRVFLIQQFITCRLSSSSVGMQQKYVESVTAGAVISLMQRANEYWAVSDIKSKDALPYTIFYNDVVNNYAETCEVDRVYDDRIMAHDYDRWRAGESCFARAPGILDAASKSRLLRFDAETQMRRLRMQSMMSMQSTRLVVQVDRFNLVQTTLGQLVMFEPMELKKKMKVVFMGEEGIDEGGVRKEFFQLLITELFDANYGMFVLNKNTHTFWFNHNSLESTVEFELIGTLLGLAIYNDVLLDLHFPPVVYKKLLGIPFSLADLVDVDPDLYRGFVDLLAFTGDVEDVYMRSFAISEEYFGETKYTDLKENGADVPLTNQNRDEYVNLYLHYILSKSVTRQFSAFEKGFRQVCGGPVLDLFRSEELQELICGSETLDFEDLEGAARYEDGYTEDSQAILWFWEVVHELKTAEQKKLLQFITGSDRAPIKGLGQLVITITKAGADEAADGRLPTSHTCFSHLLLPNYTTKEVAREKILFAINHSKGFGMI